MAIRSRLGYVLVSLRAYAPLGRPIARWAIRALCALLPRWGNTGFGALRAVVDGGPSLKNDRRLR